MTFDCAGLGGQMLRRLGDERAVAGMTATGRIARILTTAPPIHGVTPM